MTEEEWEEKFGWLPDAHGDHSVMTRDDGPVIAKLLDIADPHYIWTQQDNDERGYQIVPGRRIIGHAFYVCAVPWTEADVGTVVLADDWEEG